MKPQYCVLTLSTVFACTAVLSSCSIHTSGDNLLKGKSGLISQSYVAMDENNITALAAGQVQEILVEEGDTVVSGQELAVINSDTLQAQRAQAQAALDLAQASYDSAVKGIRPEEKQQLEDAAGIAEANLSQAEASLNQAQIDFNRYDTLHNAGSISDVEFESKRNSLTAMQTNCKNAKANLSIAKEKLIAAQNGATDEDLKKAKAAVDQAEASLKIIDVSIGKCILKAPADGLVTNINVKKGDMISSGLPAVVITDIKHPYIICNVNETDISKVTVGQEVNISFLEDKNKTYPGKVVRINKNADFAAKKASNQNGGYDILTYGVKVKFEDSDTLEDFLRSGLTAFVVFGK